MDPGADVVFSPDTGIPVMQESVFENSLDPTFEPIFGDLQVHLQGIPFLALPVGDNFFRKPFYPPAEILKQAFPHGAVGESAGCLKHGQHLSGIASGKPSCQQVLIQEVPIQALDIKDLPFFQHGRAFIQTNTQATVEQESGRITKKTAQILQGNLSPFLIGLCKPPGDK